MSNYIYHGSQGLITLPERNVQTFPSGLVRIDRVYACRKTLADRFRRDLAVGNPLPFDDGAPAIDGAFIFPDPQEVVRDDGFAEFRVSAYGRTKTTPTIEPRIANQTRRAVLLGINGVALLTQTIALFRKTVTATVVSEQLPTLNELSLSQDLFELESAFLFDESDQDDATIGAEAVITKLSTSRIATFYNLDFGFRTSRANTLLPGIPARSEKQFALPLTLDQRNFGRWTEWIFAYG
jgi:hypothetical protein